MHPFVVESQENVDRCWRHSRGRERRQRSYVCAECVEEAHDWGQETVIDGVGVRNAALRLEFVGDEKCLEGM